jgi:hypothetical protein
MGRKGRRRISTKTLANQFRSRKSGIPLVFPAPSPAVNGGEALLAFQPHSGSKMADQMAMETSF